MPFKRIEEAAFRGRSTSERAARAIYSLRKEFKIKDILSYTGFPKATYMYWQKRFDRFNPNQELETIIIKIRKDNKDEMIINKKRVQHIIQKLGLQLISFTRKSRKYNSYKGKVGKVASIRLRRKFLTNVPHQKITTDTSEFKYYDVDDKGRLIIKKFFLTYLWICLIVKY